MTPDWVTISSLATAGGTLILAIATFASIRSANRSARTAERALLVGLRPILAGSRSDHPAEKVRWGDDHWAHVLGGRGHVAVVAGVIYLAMTVRNVGAGIAVIHGWRPAVEADSASRPEPGDFRPQSRDLYIAASDTGFWQGAVRDVDDAFRDAVHATVEGRTSFFVDLLYGDHEGGQRAISRFILSPVGDDDDTAWRCAMVRHWNLDRRDPR